MVENMTSKQKQDLVWANLSFWIQWAGVKSEYQKHDILAYIFYLFKVNKKNTKKSCEICSKIK